MNHLAERRSGFTLVEIMVVIGILGMVLAMGLPSFLNTIRKDPLRQAVSDIVEGCSKARAQAILAGETAELVIDAATGQVSVPAWRAQSDPDGADATKPAPQELAGRLPFQAQLDRDIAVTLLYVNLKDRMEAEQARVRFYPNGTSDDFTIVLESVAGVRKISVDCITGLPDTEVIR